MIKTRFRFWAILMLICLLMLTIVLSLAVTISIIERNFEFPLSVLLGLVLFVFTWVWLFFGEIRTKAIKAVLDDYTITAKGFMGFGALRTYAWNDFEGYTTCLVPSKTKHYEYLYLIKDGKKIIKVSQFYHNNYSEIKQFIAKHSDYLGKEHFSYIRDLKEIFE